MKKILLLTLFLPLLLIPAYAEELTIEGKGLFVAIEGDLNTVVIVADDLYIKAFDSRLKTYKSGGFSLKSSEFGLWAHPISDTKYNIFVKTSSHTERILANLIVDATKQAEIREIPANSTGTIYPKSSIGADVSKYDIPIISRDDGTDSFLMAFTVMTSTSNLKLGEDFDFTAKVWNVRNHDRLEGADVYVEISREDYVLKTVSGTTNQGGIVALEIDGDNMIYPIFYPSWCYNVDATVEYGNYTETFENRFVMSYPTRIWEPNMDWLDLQRWDYLPEQYRLEPRVSDSNWECHD